MSIRSRAQAPLSERIRKWLQQYGHVTVSVHGGTGLIGAAGRLSLTGSRLSGYCGIGWGIGFGASVTGGGCLGDTAGWSGVLSASGALPGLLGPRVRASGTLSQGGQSGALGVGGGLGSGASLPGRRAASQLVWWLCVDQAARHHAYGSAHTGRGTGPSLDEGEAQEDTSEK